MTPVILDILMRQHLEVLAKLDDLDSALARRAAGGTMAEFVAYLDHELTAHLALEEEALFVVLARHLSPEGGPLAVMNAEHAFLRDTQAKLAAAVHAHDLAAERAQARALIDVLRGHISKEDHVLFPLAQRLLSPDEWYEVGVLAAANGASRASALAMEPRLPSAR